VDDWRTGDAVCLDCGLVLGGVFLDGHLRGGYSDTALTTTTTTTTTAPPAPPLVPRIRGVGGSTLYDSWRIFILDVCRNMHISDAVVEPAHKMFCQMVCEEDLEQFSHADFAAFAIRYCALKYCDDLRAAKDVCHYAGTVVKRSHRLEWRYPMNVGGQRDEAALGSMLQRLCFDAGISRRHTIKILKAVEALRKTGQVTCKPTTLVVACTFLFCDHFTNTRISMRTLCNLGQVSVAAVSKMVKLVRQHLMYEFRVAVADDITAAVETALAEAMVEIEVEPDLYSLIEDANIEMKDINYYRDMPAIN
jgi:transcription initiation factor TFIIIB Brf1 subunit/transcription initiation factor TFIIB